MNQYITIPNFESLSIQEMFDMAVSHIGTTRMASFDNENQLCYYSRSGCNAAPFIREEMRHFADHEAGDTSWNGLLYNGHVPEHNHEFIEMLQSVHDGAAINNTMVISNNYSQVVQEYHYYKFLDVSNIKESNSFLETYYILMHMLGTRYGLDLTKLKETFPFDFV